MEVRILAPAEAELLDAVTYYNGESEGLGYEFAAEPAERSRESSSIQMRGRPYQNAPAGVG
jgi:hypothetical protein